MCFLSEAAQNPDVPTQASCSVGGIMDTMETIEVATGLSMELKMAVAAIVVLATMLVLTMVSSHIERQPATRARRDAPRGTTRTARAHPSTPFSRDAAPKVV